jgi:hypothetical protein
MLITPENLELIGRGYTIDDYEKFYKDSIMNRKHNNRVAVELIGEKKAIEEITSEQKLDVKENDNLNGAKFVNPSQQEGSKEPSNTDLKKQEVTTPSSEGSNVQPSNVDKNTSVEETSKEAEKTEDGLKTANDSKPKEEAPKKELKKYKGLYTYDPSAPHYFVMIVTVGKVESEEVMSAINKYNSTNHALLNLNVVENSTKDFSQMFVVGTLPSAELGLFYLKQVVKNAEIKNAFGNIPYRNIVISKDNLEVLKATGNINVYMELYKRLYLNR